MDRMVNLLRQPPKWLMWVGFFLFVLVAASFFRERGIAWGVLASLTYGGIGVAGVLPGNLLVQFARRFPILDKLIAFPLISLGFAFFSHWPAWICFVAGAIFAAIILVMNAAATKPREVEQNP